MRFIAGAAPEAWPTTDEAGYADWADGFAPARARRWRRARRVRRRWPRAPTSWCATLPDLDASHPLPEAPWFPPGAARSARRVFLHIIAETAQHAGHADILRESIDGQKTMG